MSMMKLKNALYESWKYTNRSIIHLSYLRKSSEVRPEMKHGDNLEKI